MIKRYTERLSSHTNPLQLIRKHDKNKDNILDSDKLHEFLLVLTPLIPTPQNLRVHTRASALIAISF